MNRKFARNVFVLHCIKYKYFICRSIGSEEPKLLGIRRTDRLPKRPIFQVYLKDELPKGSVCELEISFYSQIWESVEGLFRGSYTDENGEKV